MEGSKNNGEKNKTENRLKEKSIYMINNIEGFKNHSERNSS